MLSELVESVRAFTDQLPLPLQLLVLAAIGAVPFLEAFTASAVGVVVGAPLVIAVVASVLGNLASLAPAVWVTGRARTALRARRGEDDPPADVTGTASEDGDFQGVPGPLRRLLTPGRMSRLAQVVDRGGVPAVCLLAPGVMPSQAVAAALVALGVAERRVLGWVTLGVVLWAVLTAVLVMLGLTALT